MKKNISNVITENKNINRKFFIEKTFEAGIVLLGWEVKSLRAKKVNIKDSYVFIRDKEPYLCNAKFTPLLTKSKDLKIDLQKEKKLLLNSFELKSLYGYINRKGYTAFAIKLYWKNAWAKLKIGLGKGKKEYDRRQDIKNREWYLQKKKILK